MATVDNWPRSRSNWIDDVAIEPMREIGLPWQIHYINYIPIEREVMLLSIYQLDFKLAFNYFDCLANYI